jgi:general secretion pathway protein D
VNTNSWKQIVVFTLIFGFCATLGWAQAPTPDKPATPAPDQKSDKNAPPKKKMKKVPSLFGDMWVEDDSPDAAAPESKTPAPQQNKPPAPAPPSATPAAGGPAQAEGKPKTEGPPSSGESTAQPPPQTPPPVPISGASLVFNNADLVQVIQVIANLLRLNYTLDPNVKGAVTITTMGDISSADLMQILQTVLRINGAAAIQTGNLWQIVPLKSAHQIPIPIEHPGEKPLSAGDEMVTEIIPMQFVSAGDMTKILKEFLSDAGSIVSHDRGNILILTDASRNMARLLDLIRTFDSDALQNKRVQLFTVKNNSVRAVIEDLKNIFSAYAMSEKESAVRFLPLDRLNAILVVAPSPAVFDTVQQWIDRLDQPAHAAGIRNYVYHVQYAKAENIRSMLAELYGSAITSSAPGVLPAAGAISTTAGMSPSTLLSQATKPEQAKQERETFGFQGNIKVVADTTNDMLIIQATPQDYELIEQTLRQIDIMPREVLIEAQIFTVDLSHDFSLGIEYTLQQRGTAPNGNKPLASFTGGVLSGSSVIMNAGARELFATITSSENRTRAKALSSPSILATDNQEARVQVGVSIPTLSSSGYTPGSTSAIINTIQNVDTGVILSVTPHISASGLVGMKITQEVSSPVPAPAGVPNISPSINRSSATTTFVVKDGETVAIAGIISENKSLTRTRIPVLGDIPVLGAAFGSTNYTNKRSELVIFITPHVVTTIDQSKIMTDALREEMKKLRKDFQEKDRERHRIWDKVQPPPVVEQ